MVALRTEHPPAFRAGQRQTAGAFFFLFCLGQHGVKRTRLRASGLGVVGAARAPARGGVQRASFIAFYFQGGIGGGMMDVASRTAPGPPGQLAEELLTSFLEVGRQAKTRS